jgi:hypothetical protein
VTISLWAIVLLYTANLQEQASLQQQRDQQVEMQRQWEVLDHASELKQQGEYLACVETLNAIPQTSPFYRRVEMLSESCYEPLAQQWLTEAEVLFSQGKLREAIRVSQRIQAGTSYALARQRIEQWSQRMIDLATQSYQHPSGFQQALHIVGAIEPSNPLFATAQTLLQQWQQEWNANSHAWNTAQAALEMGNLPLATQAAQQISVHPAWHDRRHQLLGNIQKAQLDYESVWQAATQALSQSNWAQSAQLSLQLPSHPPWIERKQQLQRQASQMQQSTRLTQVGLAMVLGIGVGFTIVACRVGV